MIEVLDEILTDGSVVWNVCLTFDYETMSFGALSRQDADDLAVSLRTAIEKHTSCKLEIT